MKRIAIVCGLVIAAGLAATAAHAQARDPFRRPGQRPAAEVPGGVAPAPDPAVAPPQAPGPIPADGDLPRTGIDLELQLLVAALFVGFGASLRILALDRVPAGPPRAGVWMRLPYA